MARILCIVSFLILVAVPAAGAMGHAHHAGHGSERTEVSAPQEALPLASAFACDVVGSTAGSMPGHGACLGCCPDRYVQGNVSPTPRVQDALSVTQRTSSPISRPIDVPVTHGARLPGLASGDFCTVLRL